MNRAFKLQQTTAHRALWKKRAPLILLVILGLFFWIPQLLRATVGSLEPTIAATEPADDGNSNRRLPLVEAGPATPTVITFHVRPPIVPNRGSASDPLTRTAELAGLSSAAFRNCRSADVFAANYATQSPLSTVHQSGASAASIGLTRRDLPTGSEPAASDERRTNDELILTGTILGRTRRAAIINGRLYREGDQVSGAGANFRLSKVSENQVELVCERYAHGRSFRRVLSMRSQEPRRRSPLPERRDPERLPSSAAPS